MKQVVVLLVVAGPPLISMSVYRGTGKYTPSLSLTHTSHHEISSWSYKLTDWDGILDDSGDAVTRRIRGCHRELKHLTA